MLGINGPSDSFQDLAAAFAERISELRRYSYLRIEDSSKELFQQDLQGLEASIHALETQVCVLKQHLHDERAAVPKVEALLKACKQQGNHLQAISQNLPVRLPKLPTASSFGAKSASFTDEAVKPGPLNVKNSSAGLSQPGTARTAGDAAPARKQPKGVPRWYITELELQSLSSYMRGRLGLDKVNQAIDEIAGHAEANSKLMQAARTASSKLSPAERKRGTDLHHFVASKENVKGCFFFLEGDLREGNVLKLDKTGKSILTILRHLGRLQEVRTSLDGSTVPVYVLQYGGGHTGL